MSHARRVTLTGLVLVLGSSEFLKGDSINVPGEFGTIQAAIDAAVSGVDEVVVAPGTYDEVVDFLGKAITLRSSGGAAVTTIDGTGLNDSVVKCISGEGADTVLDGFTITGGTGSACWDTHSCGGGMYNDNSSPTVANCTFSENSAFQGGGIYNPGPGSSPTVTNCTFSGNAASNRGGGMYNANSSSPTVINCTFSGNSSTHYGGGMHNEWSSPTVTNCTFRGNSAGQGGGIYNAMHSSPTVINCTFSGNAGDGSGMNNYYSSNPTLTNCILWGGSSIVNKDSSTPTISFSNVQGGLPAGTTDDGGNIDSDPLFFDAAGPDNIPGTDDDNLRLRCGSPGIDAGRNLALPLDTLDMDVDGDTAEPIPYDLDENTRIVDGSGNGVAIVDMGAYEFGPTSDFDPADLDRDCDVDLRDFARFQICFNVADPVACNPSATPDLDNDGRVDLDDHVRFVSKLNGPA